MREHSSLGELETLLLADEAAVGIRADWLRGALLYFAAHGSLMTKGAHGSPMIDAGMLGAARRPAGVGAQAFGAAHGDDGHDQGRMLARGAGGAYEIRVPPTLSALRLSATRARARSEGSTLVMDTAELGLRAGALVAFPSRGSDEWSVAQVTEVERARRAGVPVALVSMDRAIDGDGSGGSVACATATPAALRDSGPRPIESDADRTVIHLDGIHRSIRRRDRVICVYEGIDGAPRRLLREVASVEEPRETLASDITVPLTRVTLGGTLPEARAASFVLHYDLVPAGRPAQLPQLDVATTDLRDGLDVEGPVDPPAGLRGDVLRQDFLLEDAQGHGALVSGAVRFDRAARTARFELDSGSSLPLDSFRAPLMLYAGVTEITEGETVEREVLGSGDVRLSRQRFSLRRRPLTHLPALRAGEPPRSTLALFVDGIRWEEVESFYGVAPDERVFVVEHAADGTATVIGGDGVRGARFPTGVDNVVARYRFGAGAPVPEPNTLRLARSVPGIRSIRSPLPFTPGKPVGDDASMRTEARRRALMLERPVSAADYAALAANESGVVRVEAELGWLPDSMTVGVHLTVIGTLDPHALQSSLAAAGEPGTPIEVTLARAAPATLVIELAMDPRRLETDVERDVRAALVGEAAGVLHPSRVPLGRPVAMSAVHAAIVAVRGVVAIEHTQWSLLDEGTVRLDATGFVCVGRDRWLDLTAPDAITVRTSPAGAPRPRRRTEESV